MTENFKEIHRKIVYQSPCRKYQYQSSSYCRKDDFLYSIIKPEVSLTYGRNYEIVRNNMEHFASEKLKTGIRGRHRSRRPKKEEEVEPN